MTRDPIISEAVVNNLVSVLKALPPDLRLPRIEPDGEGSVKLNWENALVILGEKYIDAEIAKSPGSSEMIHMINFTYDSGALPEEVLLFLLEAHEKC